MFGFLNSCNSAKSSSSSHLQKSLRNHLSTFWGSLISFNYKSVEVHFPLLFLDTFISWKSLFCGIVAFFAIQICSSASKRFKLGTILGNKHLTEKENEGKKEVGEIIQAILNESEGVLNNPAHKLVIVKACLVNCQSDTPINLENLHKFEVLEDLTLVLQLYNQGSLVALPANKLDLIGFAQSTHFQENTGSIFIAYSIRGGESVVQCRVFKLDEPIVISV